MGMARGLLMLKLTMDMDMGMVAMDTGMDMVVMDTMATTDITLAKGLLTLRLTMVMDMGMVMDMDMDTVMVAMDTMDIMDMVMANRMLNVQELSTEENVKLDKPSHKLLLSNFMIVESKKCKRINHH